MCKLKKKLSENQLQLDFLTAKLQFNFRQNFMRQSFLAISHELEQFPEMPKIINLPQINLPVFH